jgi:formylglycine-generating enzyme required for sulfatase activity
MLLVSALWAQQDAPEPDPAALQAGPVNIRMALINGGRFQMGTPIMEKGRQKNQGLRHRVTLGSFSMGIFPVTQAEYQAVMGANPSSFKGGDLPVENVSWDEAVNFCNRLSRREGLTPAYTVDGANVTWNRGATGYRLPTEAEWEYACRAGTTTPFSTGKRITTDQANFDGNFPYNKKDYGIYREKTTAAGSFAPNPWGLYDMHGNVWEWCWDWHGKYPQSSQKDPAGPPSGNRRVLRGGSWYYAAKYARSGSRISNYPSYRNNYIGFRVAR